MFNLNIYKTTLETMEVLGYVVENQEHEIHIRNPFGKKLVEIFWIDAENEILIVTEDEVVYAENVRISFLKFEEIPYLILRYIDAEDFIKKEIEVSDIVEPC